MLVEKYPNTEHIFIGGLHGSSKIKYHFSRLEVELMLVENGFLMK